MRYIFLAFVLNSQLALAVGFPWNNPGCEFLVLSETAIGAVCAEYETFSSGTLKIYYRGPLWEKLRNDPISYQRFAAVLMVDGRTYPIPLTRRAFNRDGNSFHVNYGESIRSGEVLYGEAAMDNMPRGQRVHWIFKSERRDLNPGWIFDKSHPFGYASRVAGPTPARCVTLAVGAAQSILARQFDLLLAHY